MNKNIKWKNDVVVEVEGEFLICRITLTFFYRSLLLKFEYTLNKVWVVSAKIKTKSCVIQCVWFFLSLNFEFLYKKLFFNELDIQNVEYCDTQYLPEKCRQESIA